MHRVPVVAHIIHVEGSQPRQLLISHHYEQNSFNNIFSILLYKTENLNKNRFKLKMLI